MINLYDAEIVDILPESISDPDEVKAVSYAIKKAMQKNIPHSRSCLKLCSFYLHEI